ncbi:hypothetical protein HAX54_019366 [Datura stramonium]|uniref:Uncharacterized protein n=1 Tax=Datura stramonium TaxID=4076 RepID=A0ABS8Y7G5_DATST|nr:hypothetical protein [Datura stramonium]
MRTVEIGVSTISKKEAMGTMRPKVESSRDCAPTTMRTLNLSPMIDLHVIGTENWSLSISLSNLKEDGSLELLQSVRLAQASKTPTDLLQFGEEPTNIPNVPDVDYTMERMEVPLDITMETDNDPTTACP